jgi:hypothetical protein
MIPKNLNFSVARREINFQQLPLLVTGYQLHICKLYFHGVLALLFGI